MATALPNPTELWLSTLGWQPDADQQNAFQDLHEALIRANQQVNLTRITSAEDFWEKHLWDSLQGIAPWLVEESKGGTSFAEDAPSSDAFKVVDIGTGGGFPGLPVALVLPQWQVSMLDSTRKKIAALESMVKTLGLTNVHLLAERAEQVGHQPTYREAFDLALIRAVGPTNTCAEYALPLVKPGGRVVLYRGQWEPGEEQDLKAVLPQLGGQLLSVRRAETPMTHGVRHYVEIQKTGRTPDAFPRLPGVPAKSPLKGS
jgi:16S rRNA (guanine527-N7)-methyltransferase